MSEWTVMSTVMDETATDLPVRDVGLMRGGLMPTVPGLYIIMLIWENNIQCQFKSIYSLVKIQMFSPDTLRDVKTWKKHHVTKTKGQIIYKPHPLRCCFPFIVQLERVNQKERYVFISFIQHYYLLIFELFSPHLCKIPSLHFIL